MSSTAAAVCGIGLGAATHALIGSFGVLLAILIVGAVSYWRS